MDEKQILNSIQRLNGSNPPITEQATRVTNLEARMHQAEERIRQLEQHIHYPNTVIADKMTAMKESAARVDTAPMRSDVETIMKLKEFVESLSSQGNKRYCVPQYVNIWADEALGRKV